MADAETYLASVSTPQTALWLIMCLNVSMRIFGKYHTQFLLYKSEYWIRGRAKLITTLFIEKYLIIQSSKRNKIIVSMAFIRSPNNNHKRGRNSSVQSNGSWFITFRICNVLYVHWFFCISLEISWIEIVSCMTFDVCYWSASSINRSCERI